MIVWLASYPKSGNTLLRSILTSYFFSQNGDFNFELLNKIGQFPNIEIFNKLGINTLDENLVFKNLIKDLLQNDKYTIEGANQKLNLLKLQEENQTEEQN